MRKLRVILEVFNDEFHTRVIFVIHSQCRIIETTKECTELKYDTALSEYFIFLKMN